MSNTCISLSWFVICVSLAAINSSMADKADHDCTPPIDGCVCNKGSLICRGSKVDHFPNITAQQDVFTTFSFTECSLDVIVEIPYPLATQLFIDKCHVKTIAEGALSKLTHLTDIALTGNRFHNLSKTTFSNLTNLTSLVLSYNQITSLPEGIFDGLPNLKTLDLSTNNVVFTSNLFRQSNISSFTCMSCGLLDIPAESLAKLANLKELNLNSNNFSALSHDVFSTLGSLEKLHLDSCSISSFDELTFWNLYQLTLIDLGNNQLRELPQGAFQTCWTTLKVLYLEGNRFETMIEDRAPWKNLAEVKLGNNPWSCDCIIAWMHTYNLRNIDKENVTCSSPEGFKGKNLFNVEANMLCYSGHSRAGIVLGIAIPVIIICFALIGYYLYQITRNRKRQAHDRQSFKYRSVYGETVESNSKQSILT